jgi:hypothetical protein
MGILILVSIIVGAGLLGGAANYYMEKPSEGGASNSFFKSTLLGLTAAATVPLFLKTVSSNLMNECLAGDPVSHFVFFGFCTIAAIFSSKFLQSLADKLLQEVKEMKEKQEEMNATTETLVMQNSDPIPSAAPIVAAGSEFESTRSVDAPPPLSEEQRVLNVLKMGKFAFRTAEGLAKDSGMDLGATQAKLLELEARNLVKKTKRASDGATVWSLR